MTQQTYTPPQEKIVTSVALEKDVKEWIDNNIPDRRRSDFINTLARRYIRRRQAVELRRANETERRVA